MSRRALGLDGTRTGMRQRTAMVVQMTAQKMNSVIVIGNLLLVGVGSGSADDGVGTANDAAHLVDERAFVHLDAVLGLNALDAEVDLREAFDDETCEWCHVCVSM